MCAYIGMSWCPCAGKESTLNINSHLLPWLRQGHFLVHSRLQQTSWLTILHEFSVFCLPSPCKNNVTADMLLSLFSVVAGNVTLGPHDSKVNTLCTEASPLSP